MRDRRHIPGLWIVVTLLVGIGIATGMRRLTHQIAMPIGAVPPPAVAVARSDWPDMRFDVNTASAAELELLPGIGPTLAGNIIAMREARGGFSTVEELDDVPRIGPITLEKIRPFIVVEASPQEASEPESP